MGNTHSHHHHESREDSKSRYRDKRNSRIGFEHSNNTTSTSSSSVSRSQSTRAASSPQKFLGRHSRSLNDSHKIRDQTRQDPETKPPIRIGYPYYEEVTILAEKGDKKHKRQSLRRSMRSSWLLCFGSSGSWSLDWSMGLMRTKVVMDKTMAMKTTRRKKLFWHLRRGITMERNG